ncbi:MAG TPA: hypothetical protein VGE11_02315 [Pseudonocardia sp.]
MLADALAVLDDDSSDGPSSDDRDDDPDPDVRDPDPDVRTEPCAHGYPAA